MLEALCLLPLRPGAMADLNSGQVRQTTRRTDDWQDKPHHRKNFLPENVVVSFKQTAKANCHAVYISHALTGSRGIRTHGKKTFKAAAIQAGLTSRATTYSLRHSTITDLVPHLDLLTIAQISGTSVQMIQSITGICKDRAVEMHWLDLLWNPSNRRTKLQHSRI